MSELVVDSSVLAKWFVPEADSPQAERVQSDVINKGGRIIVLDLALIEVSNVLWKQFHRSLMPINDVRDNFQDLCYAPIQIRPAAPLLSVAFEISLRYDRAYYDALFVALAQDLGLPGVTADEPLYRGPCRVSLHRPAPRLVISSAALSLRLSP